MNKGSFLFHLNPRNRIPSAFHSLLFHSRLHRASLVMAQSVSVDFRRRWSGWVLFLPRGPHYHGVTLASLECGKLLEFRLASSLGINIHSFVFAEWENEIFVLLDLYSSERDRRQTFFFLSQSICLALSPESENVGAGPLCGLDAFLVWWQHSWPGGPAQHREPSLSVAFGLVGSNSLISCSLTCSASQGRWKSSKAGASRKTIKIVLTERNHLF